MTAFYFVNYRGDVQYRVEKGRYPGDGSHNRSPSDTGTCSN